MKKIILTTSFLLILFNTAFAQNDNGIAQYSKTPHKTAFEVNLFSAFLGISDLRIVSPASKSNIQNNGSYILGIYTDHAWGKLSRPTDKYGKVRFIGTKVGWNQDFGKYVFGEITLNIGHRHEEKNIYDGTTLNSLSSRLFLVGGGKINLTENVYCKMVVGAGIHILRTGDKYESTEKKVIPAVNINLGFKF